MNRDVYHKRYVAYAVYMATIDHPINQRSYFRRAALTAPKKSSGGKKTSKRFIFLYTLATVGLYAALITPVVIGLSLHLAVIDEAAKEQNLALVLGVGAAFALVSNPIFGRLSDRTRSRFGMRRPWMVGGSLAGLAALYFISTSTSVLMILIGWCIAQIAFNAALATLTAVLPDQVPVKQRGTVSGFLGIAISVGVLVGIFFAQLAGTNVTMLFLGPGIFGVACVLLFAATLKDRKLSRSEKLPKYSVGSFFSSFWLNPIKNPDYAWAWISRFMLFLGLATLSSYQTYFMMDRFGFAADSVATRVFIATLVSSVCVVIASAFSGILSDKLGRRKGFVVMSSLLYAVALFFIAQVATFEQFLFAVVLAGIAQGVYLAVDLALVTQVLPNKRDSAKDLGVLNIANSAPQSIAPAIAPIFLAINGPDNYTSLFVAAAVFGVIGALTVLPIKRVR